MRMLKEWLHADVQVMVAWLIGSPSLHIHCIFKMRHGMLQHITFLAASTSFLLYDPSRIEPLIPRMCMLPVVVILRSWAAHCCGARRTGCSSKLI